MLVDLHIHTTASDGTWEPVELVENIKKAEIGIFSVSDHDSIKNVSETIELAKKENLLCIPAVEINSFFSGKNYHILAYCADHTNKELLELFETNRHELELKDNETIKIMEKRFDRVSFDEYLNYENDPSRGGWKALNYLLDKGVCKDYKELFTLIEQWGNPFEKVNFHHVSKVIEIISKANGFSVLAHPGAKFYDSDYKWIIDNMLEMGIDGIECFHVENSDEVTEHCLDVCKKNNLIITGGSDCHGTFVKTRKLAIPRLTLDMLDIRRMI